MEISVRTPQFQFYGHSNISTSQNMYPSDTRDDKVNIANETVSRREIEIMNDKVMTELNKNIQKYQILKTANPYFSIKLYAPHNNFKPDQYTKYSIELMLNQIDVLLEEGHNLDKQIRKCQLRKIERQNCNQLDEWRNHYAFLRKIWINDKEQEVEKSVDRIEQLNKRVAIIKKNICSMAVHQKNCYDSKSEGKYFDVKKKIQVIVSQTEQYSSLKQQYETLKMEFESVESKVIEIHSNYQLKLQQKELQFKKLKIENEQFKRLLNEAKNKLLMGEIKQSKLLLQISELQDQIKSNKQTPSVLTNKINISNSSLKLLKEQNFNVQHLKFTKIDVEIKNKLFMKFSDKINQQTMSYQVPALDNNLNITPLQETTNQYDFKNIEDQANVEGKESVLRRETSRASLMSFATSVDSKRNRFTRMRSPINSKLNKVKSSDYDINSTYGVSNANSPHLKNDLNENMLVNLVVN